MMTTTRVHEAKTSLRDVTCASNRRNLLGKVTVCDGTETATGMSLNCGDDDEHDNGDEETDDDDEDEDNDDDDEDDNDD